MTVWVHVLKLQGAIYKELQRNQGQMGPWPRFSSLLMLPSQIFNWHQGKYSKVNAAGC